MRERGARARSILLAVAAAAAVAVIGARRAEAQTAPARADDYAFGASRGVFIPGRALTGDADATALELNPGQLGLLGDASLIFVGDGSSAGAGLPGRGAALFYAAPFILSGTFALGLQGIGSVDVPATSTSPALSLDGHTKLQIGYGLRLGRSLGVGLSWAHVFGSLYGGTDTFDAGASARLGRRLAVGVVVQDIFEPRPNPLLVPLPRVWSAELAIRPLGTDRLEVAGAAVHVTGDPWDRITPRFRALGRVITGLRLFAEVETVPRGAALAFADGADYRVTAGLWVDSDHLGAAVAARTVQVATGAGAGGVDDGWGGSLLVRASGDRYPDAIDRRHVERVSVAGIDSDRELLNLVVRLRALAADDTVAGVMLKITDLEVGTARVEELRDLIGLLRQRGKKVIAYTVSPSMREYYLASACDGIIVPPAGTVTLNGLSQSVTFYKRALDRLGVDVQLVRIAEYKGAMEPFIQDEYSEPVRRNRNSILDDVFARLVNAFAQDRRRSLSAAASRGGAAAALTPERIRAIIDRGLFTPVEAQELGLIDAVADEADVPAYIARALGRSWIDVREPDASPLRPTVWRRPRVAVVLVDGTIVDGVSQQLPFDLGSFAGAATLMSALEECRRDPSIAAVVLRVNSPGGSAFASDVLARAIVKVRAAGKPVVVSMGDYAASGGYYIAAPGNVIFAEPSTITGSIGIFAYKADVQKLATTVGVSVETFRRGLHADAMSIYRPWTEDEVALLADKLRYAYKMFLDVVAEGRKSRGITVDRANELGRGHVWTGSQAYGLGLVDQRGGVADALDRAAELAHVGSPLDQDSELLVLPRPPGGLLQRAIGLAAQEEGEKAEAGARERPPLSAADLGARLLIGPGGRPALRLVAPLLAGPGTGVEARMPFDLEIR